MAAVVAVDGGNGGPEVDAGGGGDVAAKEAEGTAESSIRKGKKKKIIFGEEKNLEKPWL